MFYVLKLYFLCPLNCSKLSFTVYGDVGSQYRIFFCYSLNPSVQIQITSYCEEFTCQAVGNMSRIEWKMILYKIISQDKSGNTQFVGRSIRIKTNFYIRQVLIYFIDCT